MSRNPSSSVSIAEIIESKSLSLKSSFINSRTVSLNSLGSTLSLSFLSSFSKRPLEDSDEASTASISRVKASTAESVSSSSSASTSSSLSSSSVSSSTSELSSSSPLSSASSSSAASSESSASVSASESSESSALESASSESSVSASESSESSAISSPSSSPASSDSSSSDSVFFESLLGESSIKSIRSATALSSSASSASSVEVSSDSGRRRAAANSPNCTSWSLFKSTWRRNRSTSCSGRTAIPSDSKPSRISLREMTPSSFESHFPKTSMTERPSLTIHSLTV